MKLKAKVVSFFLALSLVSGGAIIVLARKSIGNIITKNLAEDAISKASRIADKSAPSFGVRQEAALLPALQDAQREVGAEFAACIDTAGIVLAHTNVAETGSVYRDDYASQLLQKNTPGSYVLRREKGPLLLAWAPVVKISENENNEAFQFGEQPPHHSKSRLGLVILGLPLQQGLSVRSRMTLHIALHVAVTAAIAVVFALFLVRKEILLPVRQLLKATALITKGDYGITVPVRSPDELGELGQSFNHMSRVLSETTVSKDFLSAILSHMIDPLIVMNLEGTIQMVNQATLDLLDYEKPDLVGQRYHKLLMPKDVSSPGAQDETLILKGPVRNLEIDLIKRTGDKVPVLFSSSMMKDESGAHAGVIAIAKDVTERKRLEGIIRQSDKMSAVGQLAAGVAHEINNPLGIILGFAQASLRRVAPGSELELPLKSIEKESIRCKDLVQDLLTFSRASRVEREPLDINTVIDSALSLINARARTDKVEVRRVFAASLPHILGNSNQIQQMIINLANNAMDAMESGGILTFSTESLREGPLSWICLKVIDTGTGIPHEILSRIFDPFFTTKPVGKGTGLGLSLVHEMVKKHSGMIDVESRPGHTQFRIKFPVRTGKENEGRTLPNAPEVSHG